MSRPEACPKTKVFRLVAEQDLEIWNHLGVVVNWLLGACKMRLRKHPGKLLGACKLDLGKAPREAVRGL